MASLVIVWVLFMNTVKVLNVYSSIIKTPQLGLRVSVTPKTDIVSGDIVQYSFEVSHAKKSFADALDVEIQILSPAFLVFGNHTVKSSSIEASNETKSDQEMVFKFANISENSHVSVTMDIRVDPYYMLGSRDEVIASSSVKLWYYGELDSCHRPASKWNARSLSDTIRFTFVANKVCERPVDQLGESQFSASSFHKPNFHALGNSPHHAGFTHDQVWIPADTMTKDIHQYLQIELEQLMRITKIATKGNGNTYPSSFVRKYVLYHSRDGVHWSMAYAGLKSKEFQANVDSTTLKMNDIRVPIEARLLRVVPKTWKNKIALKVKLFGCLVYHVPAGHQPLGVSSSRIRDNQLSVESGNQQTYPPYNARLNLNHGIGGWCTTTILRQTLVVDLGEDYVITEFAVQSKFQATNKLISSFYLAYKNDGGLKTSIKENGNKKIFLGNPVEDTTIKHRLLGSVKARHVYIEPKQMSSNTGCLRMELYGYKEDQVPPSDYCSIFDFENDGLLQWSLTGSAFDNQPTFLDNRHVRTGHVVNHEGAWWIGTRENRNTPYIIPGQIQGNYPTGTLTSPGFLISFSKLFFLFAGTANQEKARVELTVDTAVVRVAWSGTGNDSMVQMNWDVQEFLGREARIRLVDNATDGFVSFDGLKSNCHPTQEKLTVFEKSFLLSPSNNTLYICQFSHTSNPGNTACRLTSDNGQSWHDLSSQVSGLLGVHEVSGKVYGVSRDWRDYLESADWEGKSWTQINSSIWKRIKQDVALITVVEIPHIPITGLPETDDPSQILNLVAQSGDGFAASSRGVHHKPSPGSWTMIATWHCKEYPNICISNPCNNAGVCHVLLDGGFNCTCPQGFTGEICDNTIDDCQNDSCLNGGKCIDGFNKFFCSCNSFFTGARCERNIDDCTASPCGPGASCIDGLGNFTCQCPNGFIGEFCELEIDECASVPCQHGGHCVDEVNSYTCHCRGGYSGTNCEHVHSSAFEVMSSRSIQYGVSHFLVVHARIPSDGRSLHRTWCQDYTALCYSLNKTRPTGCGRSFNHITDNHRCLTNYDSVMDHNDTLGCPPNGRVSSIANLAGYGSSTADNSFAFSQCADTHCTDVLPISGCHGALSCISQAVVNREVYTLCTDSDSNFFVEDKRYTSFKGVNYLALYVRPRTNIARHENWCRDYQRLCQSYGKRPTECGNKNSTDSASRQCQKKYFSVNMAANNELGCENSVVERIGQDAGLPSTSHHIIFHNCSASVYQNCSGSMYQNCSGSMCQNCSGSMYQNCSGSMCQNCSGSMCQNCSGSMCQNCSGSMYQNCSGSMCQNCSGSLCQNCSGSLCQNCSASVYQNCSGSVYQNCSGSMCQNCSGSMCQNCSGSMYQNCSGSMCQNCSGSMCQNCSGSMYQNCSGSMCQNCSGSVYQNCSGSVYQNCSASVYQNCSASGCHKEIPSCSEMRCLNDTNLAYHALCTEPQTSFTVLDERRTMSNNLSWLIIKAKLPRDRKSTQENWCRDYSTLCESYGLRPTGSDVTYDHDYTSCWDNYKSVVIGGDFFGVAPQVKTAQLAQQAGFSSATPSNSFVLNKCTKCPSVLSSTDCTGIGLGCINPSSHGDVYTVCVEPQTALDVQETKSTVYNNTSYLAVKAKLTGKKKSKLEDWRMEYKKLCLRYGRRALKCNGSFASESSAVELSHHVCHDNGQPDANSLKTIVQTAGFSDATNTNTLIFHSYQEDDPWLSYTVLYTLCHGSDSNFDVISAKVTKYQGLPNLVIKARLPSHGMSRYKDWCEDYKRLCHSYGQRPTGCGGATYTATASYTACRDSYDSLTPEDNKFGCPSNNNIAFLANEIGFSEATINNTFALSLCNDTCSKNISEKDNFISYLNPSEPVYTMCVGSNSSFNVESTKDISYQGGFYKVIKASIPSHMSAKHENWCRDYQKLCESYGLRAVVTSKESDLTCESTYNAIAPRRNELSAPEKLKYLVEMAGYFNSSAENIFAFDKTCQRSCFVNLVDFKSVKESAFYVDSGTVAVQKHVVYALCMNSDSNFKVVDSRSLVYQNRFYLVLKTLVPHHGHSKFDNWCLDYQRLCTGYQMRPVTILDTQAYNNMKSCTPDYMSVVVPRNLSQNLLTRDHVSVVANIAGYYKASRDNSFAFRQCNPRQCSRVLRPECSSGLDCLTNLHREVYTLCMDSDSNFVVEQTRQVSHKGVPYLLIQSRLPEHGLARHKTWCSDYQHLCNSFGMQPTGCGASSNTPGNSRCIVDYQSFVSPIDNIRCGDEAVTILKEMNDQNSFKGETMFVFKNCENCSKSIFVSNNENKSDPSSCGDALYCLRQNKTVVTICSKLESRFKVLETKQYDYNGDQLTIAKTMMLVSDGSSSGDNWCHDYEKMCSSLGKRPFSCGISNDVIQYKHREQYNAFLSNSGICSSLEKLSSIALKAGFSLAAHVNLLTFINCTTCTEKLKHNISCSEVVEVTSETTKNCCKCSNTTVNSNNTLVTTLLANTSFSTTWKGCIELKLNKELNQTLNENCSIARDCLNDTLLANNSCELLSKCFHGNCFDCCACNYSRRNKSQPVKENNVVYTFCSDYSHSNFVVHEVREVEYAGLPYTVLRAQVPSHGYSKSGSWCEDYRKLCESIGKRPVGCGKEAEVIKQSRDCRLQYDAVMLEGMSCPGSQEVADIAMLAGFSASVNQSLGLWKCDECSRNFTDMWNGINSSSNVYTLCYGSHSNFNVFEKRVVEFRETPVTVVMATVPHDGLSLHEDWCLDYSSLCQSYGLRPVGCGKSRDTINVQCRDRYNAVMFSDDIIDCSGGFNAHSIAQSAGFKQATSDNSFIFNSCLAHHCTKYLPSSQAVEHAFGHLNSTDQVVYTLCVSSSSSYDVIATKAVTVDQQDYLVIRAKIPVDGESKYKNWCLDYQRLCEGYGMRPLTCRSSDSRQRNCMYNYEALTMAASDKSCPITSGVAYIAQQAGFDNVSSTNSFAFDYCDQSTSCVAKIPNTFCWNQTDYDSVFTTVTTQANITRVDFTQFISTATGVNGTDIVNSTMTGYCFIIPDTNPPFTVDGMDIKLVLKNFTCKETFNSQTPGYIISYFNMTANQTFEKLIPRVTRLCQYNSPSSLARVSGEVNTVCLRPGVGTHFLVKNTRKITNSGREYLIIKTELLSSTSKSENWCSEYTNLCQSFGTSPLACPRKYGFNGDYLKCLSNYEAIMMNDVGYSCPSNGFISELAQTAGYRDASLSNSFALLNCGENECQSKLPLVGCSESLHCLSEQVVHQHVYTACVVANSDSNFHVIEKRKKTINSKQYTVIHSRIPSDGKSLHDNWCLDYQRLCESMDLRPVHCKNGISAEESGLCKEKYNAVSEESKGCPIRVYQIAKSAGFSAANNQNSFSFHRCDSCSRVLTTQCSKSLKCLRSNAPVSEVYTICRDARTETNFAPLATKRIRHGGLGLRVIQAKLRSKYSANSDWGRDYENLCKSYNELPTGCGNPAGEKDPGVYFCGEKYSSYVLPGGELGCDPNDVISKLARDAGFVNASPKNSFGFSSCNGSVSTLSSSCHSYLPCLAWQEMDPVVYTVCIKKLVSNFRVLSTKMVKLRHLVVHAQLPIDGRSLHTDWCVDYQKLCDSYGMRPTGCGGSAMQYSNYSTCSSKYDSYMPASNNLGCGNSKIASRIANKAGYIKSIPGNTFVFHACDQCKSVLADSSQCDVALGCINNMVWKKEVYTLCVDPTTSFDVVKTASVMHNDNKYLVLEAQLPANGRAKAENWCREYELLCQLYKKRPVSCERNDRTSECLKKYQSVEQSGLGLSCDSSSTVVSQIALNAGFPKATASNSFIFNNCDSRSCSKELPTSGCDPGLSCIHSSIVGNVYTICSEETSVFRALPTRKLSVSGHVYTIVPAVFPQDMNSTWCQDYSKLCHSIGQSPVVLSSDVINTDMLKCRDEYDGVFLPKEEEFEKDGIHRLAVKAGFKGASYGNTFVFKNCAESSCQVRSRAFNCSHSLHCLNGESKVVYGICVENTPRSNFYVLDTKTVGANDTKYLALKVRVPFHRLSKYESWCRDYERLCHSYNMRPLTTLPSLACQLQYLCLFHKDYHYLSFINLVQKAGFFNVSAKNFYFLQQCGTNECARTFQLPQCTSGFCSSSVTQTRVLYALCGLLREDSTTNFEVQDVRNVWFNAPLLVAQVRLPSHRMSKEENWCKEYQTFCGSYARRPYISTGLSKKEMFDTAACYWKYNATSYRQPMSSSAIVQRAGFNPSSESCTSSLHRCSSCGKVLNSLTCPFENCQAAVETCLDYYIICT